MKVRGYGNSRVKGYETEPLDESLELCPLLRPLPRLLGTRGCLPLPETPIRWNS